MITGNNMRFAFLFCCFLRIIVFADATYWLSVRTDILETENGINVTNAHFPDSTFCIKLTASSLDLYEAHEGCYFKDVRSIDSIAATVIYGPELTGTGSNRFLQNVSVFGDSLVWIITESVSRDDYSFISKSTTVFARRDDLLPPVAWGDECQTSIAIIIPGRRNMISRMAGFTQQTNSAVFDLLGRRVPSASLNRKMSTGLLVGKTQNSFAAFLNLQRF
jgi:hypothetical protein